MAVHVQQHHEQSESQMILSEWQYDLFGGKVEEERLSSVLKRMKQTMRDTEQEGGWEKLSKTKMEKGVKKIEK